MAILRRRWVERVGGRHQMGAPVGGHEVRGCTVGDVEAEVGAQGSDGGHEAEVGGSR